MKRNPRDRRATYLVILEQKIATLDEVQELAEYLSFLSVLDLDVVVIDGSPLRIVERNRRVLRWVARHVTLRAPIDPVRAAIDFAACEKVIVADDRVRYCEETLDDICALLDMHEVVEPQDYFDPLPWWGGVDTGRMLVHRGIDPLPDHGATFGFRRSAMRGLRSVDSSLPSSDHVRRLAAQGAEVFSAMELFVRRLPPMLADWWQERPVQAGGDFALPAKTIFFFSLMPILLVLAMLGGARVAGGYAGAIAFGSLALALRGRAGTGRVFPWRACLYAPVWVLERSISVYWALFRKLSEVGMESAAPLINRPEEDRRVYPAGPPASAG